MNTTPTTPPGYDTKPNFYFEWAREEMLPFIPKNCRRLLDVGCGAGAFGALLKRDRKIEVWGVEPVISAFAKASDRLDHVINRPFDSEVGLPEGAFDCIVFNDVLEHLVSPEEALQLAKALLSPGGTLVASIPNVQYIGVLGRLVFRGQWDYADSGVLDKTHLRFFTKSSISKMFQSEGYDIERICGINPYDAPPGVGKRSRAAFELANRIFLGKFTDMKFPQFAVVARETPGLQSGMPVEEK